MSIAIIPARGGSKRIPRKNIKLFHGKPIMAYSVAAAKESGLFEHIVVSTDDAEISLIANELGAEVPFVRPAELANDYTATVPVIAHAIEFCLSLGWRFDNVCCIYPAAPFINVEDLTGSFYRFNQSNADYCYPVTRFPSIIQRALRLNNDEQLSPFYPEYEGVRTQDFEPAYYDVGQFYWGRIDAWLLNHNIHSNGLGYEIPNWRVVDIDTVEDWMRAEMMASTILVR